MADLWSNAPLHGIRVVELAGLAPGPFCGMILADFGATVLRIDRAHPDAHGSGDPPPPTADFLVRNKSSIAVNLKSPGGLALLWTVLRSADVLIDPFRPGVLESLNLAPTALLDANPQLIVARLTGFRRDGPYADMAGHDINYLAVSGVLSQLGRAEYAPSDKAGQAGRRQPPQFPGNLLADFAGGGLMCAFGVMTALMARTRNGGRGQVVHANMVDGVSYLGTFLRLTRKTPYQDRERGRNMLDGGSPWYDVYETSEPGRYMSVGALEPQFFALLVDGLGLDRRWNEIRMDDKNWPELRRLITDAFRSKTRAEWEKVFEGKDACVLPILSQDELERAGYEHRPAVGLSVTPSRPIDQRHANNPVAIPPGHGGETVLKEWLGWEKGRQYKVEEGGLIKSLDSKL